jgi:cytochrome c oxidase assembly factor CtaG
VTSELLGEWSTDGTIGLVFSGANVIVGSAYLTAAEVGRRRDRRGRGWPRVRTASFLIGLTVLLVTIDGPIGGAADMSLAAHMAEHMALWLVVAPLLVAGAPFRLALFATGSGARGRLGRVARSRPVRGASSAAVSTIVFSTVVVGSHVPAVYDLALDNDLAHVAEHAIYLVTATLVWAPLIGADPLPHRPTFRVRCVCMIGCMAAMAAVSVCLLLAPAPVYAPYESALGAASALRDQKLAGVIMFACGFPALLLAALASSAGAAWRGGELRAYRR